MTQKSPKKSHKLWPIDWQDSAQLMYILSIAIAVIAALLAFWFFWQGRPVQRVQEVVEDVVTDAIGTEPCDHMRLLDGVCVEHDNDTAPQLVAVMVENHIEAQPLSGIAQASVVYEAPVEGSIPRLMALYPADTDVQKVGPVRSARPYYLDWVHEYGDVMYAHVGGSPEALERISNEGIFDLNEFSRGWYFWRSKDRFAPHNTYTSENLWTAALERYGDADADHSFDAWTYGTMDPCEEECIGEISFIYGGGSYAPSWTYNSDTGRYERKEFGRTDRDQQGAPIVADTVIVQYVEAAVIDEVGRLRIDTIGSGDAAVFRDGHAVEGEWQKEDRDARTRFVDEDAHDIPLKQGKIWVQVVSQFNAVDY